MDTVLKNNRARIISRLLKLSSRGDWKTIRDLIYLPILADSNGKYVAISCGDEEKVSYARSYKDRYDSKRRIKTTLSKYVRKQLKIDTKTISDHLLADITSEFNSRLNANYFINVVSGSVITEYYQKSFGGQSCMTGNDSNKVELFAINDNIQLLTYDNGIKARALLWTTDSGQKVLDRIYPNSGKHIYRIHGWCKKNNIVYRVSQGLPEGNVILSDNKKYSITLKYDKYLPYLDTFRSCIDNEDGTMVASNCHTVGAVTVDWTSGNLISEDNEEYCLCGRCGGSVRSNEILCDYDDNGCCEDCYDETTFNCEECSDNIHLDDLAFDHTCRVCARRNGFICCDECGKWTDGYATINDTCYCNSCSENSSYCENCNERVWDRDYNNEQYCCKDCEEEEETEEEETPHKEKSVL